MAAVIDFEIAPSHAFVIEAERASDIPAREALLDRAMGPGRKRKSSEKLRRGRLPAEGLAFVARNEAGDVIATVRLWNVQAGFRPRPSRLASLAPQGERENMLPHPEEAHSAVSKDEGSFEPVKALLLGPLAVDPSAKSGGIGSALMRHAIAEAGRLGHGAILLVGDAPYYARFGFSADATATLMMPGPFERSRFLALELTDGALDGAAGILTASGRLASCEGVRRAA